MKKIMWAGLIVLAVSGYAFAEEYESSYGFIIDVPEHWLVLTPSEIKANQDLFDLENADFGKIDKNILQQVMQKISSGNMEIYLNQETADAAFTDNINIIKQPGKLPGRPDQVEKQCQVLGVQLSQYFGRDIHLYECQTTHRDNKLVFMSEFDGAISGTRSMQYQFQKSPSVLIIITATSKNATMDTVRKEFTGMINSIRFN